MRLGFKTISALAGEIGGIQCERMNFDRRVKKCSLVDFAAASATQWNGRRMKVQQ